MNKYFLSTVLALTFCFAKAQGPYPSSNMSLVGFINPETVSTSGGVKYSGCWGYNQTSKNKEYAVSCSSRGTFFIDITAPATPTVCDYVAGTSSPGVWREVNVYQNYAYVVSDNSAPNSFQIIDMQYLPDSVHVVHNSNSVYFERGHQVYVDVNTAKLYVAGLRTSTPTSYNMRVYSLATPSVPVLLRTLSQDYPSISYVHDMHVRNDTVFAFAGNSGMHAYKLTASNTFSLLGSLTGYTDAGYCHAGSLTKDGKTMIMCDEVPTGLRIKKLDLTNLGSMSVSSAFEPTTNSQYVAHNPYVVGNNYALVSCYQDGIYLYDISAVGTPTIAGYFDSHPQGGISNGNNYGSTSYDGNWGAFPYFKSGLILLQDMQNGIFIIRANALAPVANFNNAASICSGATTTFTDVSTNSPASWSWTMPGASPATSTLQSPSITYATGGVYSATLIATNGNGTSTAVKSITVTTSPTVTAGGTSSICSGSSATLTAIGASTYTWNPGALTGANVVVSPSSTTIYTVTGFTGSCSNVKTKTLTVTASPTINTSASSSAICIGQNASLIASGATTYTWMPGSLVGSTVSTTPTITTNYTVTASNGTCTTMAVRTVSVNALLTVNATSSSSLMCVGQTVTLTGTGATSYTWMPGSITGNPIAASPASSITYTVIGAAASSCSNSSMVTVSVSACTGINSVNGLENNLEIIPNPNNGQFIIKTDITEAFDISIYNSIGQLIKFIPKNNSNVNVDLSNYSKGMYNVLFNVNGSYKNLKVIVE